LIPLGNFMILRGRNYRFNKLLNRKNKRLFFLLECYLANDFAY
jgi:hypothetical protein